MSSLRRVAGHVALLYGVLIIVSSFIFIINDYFMHGTVNPRINYFPTEAHYPYLSLVSVGLSLYILTRFLERRPFHSLGLLASRFTPILFFSGWIAQLVIAIAATYILLYLQMGLLPKWPFFSFESDLTSLEFVHDTFQTLIVPVYEELLFRGYLLQTLWSGLGSVPAVLLSSFLFGLIHFPLHGSVGVLGATMLGILCAIACLKTRSLWLPIGIHFGLNFLSTHTAHFAYLVVPTTMYKDVPSLHVLGISDPLFSLEFLVMALLLLAIPLRPTQEARALWDRYVRPVSWPPWQRRLLTDTAEHDKDVLQNARDADDKSEPP